MITAHFYKEMSELVVLNSMGGNVSEIVPTIIGLSVIANMIAYFYEVDEEDAWAIMEQEYAEKLLSQNDKKVKKK